MAVKKNLVVSIDEEGVAGEKDVLSFRTTVTGKVVVEAVASKLILNPNHIEGALREIQSFIQQQGYNLSASPPSESSSNHLIVEGDDV